jgi:hypothetical protein
MLRCSQKRIQARDSLNAFSLSSCNKNWTISLRFSETALNSIKLCYGFSVCNIILDGGTDGRTDERTNRYIQVRRM